MMKMYHEAPHGGGAAFWEKTWADGQLDEAIRFCEVDPLRPLFERFAPAGKELLEGGCGRGNYVVYYSSKGVRVTGLDFAAGAVRRLKTRSPEARLCVGNVAALPLRDHSHDVYYSGGVVEHFEGGPLPALREAYRVLRPAGVFLVSVPYLSPLRRASALWRADRHIVADVDRAAEGWRGTFWQYAFGVREFSELLRTAGFRVDRTLPYAILYGLYDVPFVASILARHGVVSTLTGGAQEPCAGSARTPNRISLGKRLLVTEDRRVPGLGLLVSAAGRLCANMMMYVCTKAES